MIIIMRVRRVCVHGAHYTREGASSQYCDIRYSVIRALRGTTECAMTLPLIWIDDLRCRVYGVCATVSGPSKAERLPKKVARARAHSEELSYLILHRRLAREMLTSFKDSSLK